MNEYIFANDRLRNRRIEKGYKTQDKLLEAMKNCEAPMGRNTLSKIESNNVADGITLKQLLCLCELLECDVNFLLGQNDYSNKEIEVASSVTGLSEEAISIISYYSRNDISRAFKETRADFLSLLLSKYTSSFSWLLESIMNYFLSVVMNDRNMEDIHEAALITCLEAIQSMGSKALKDEDIIRIINTSELYSAALKVSQKRNISAYNKMEYYNEEFKKDKDKQKRIRELLLKKDKDK